MTSSPPRPLITMRSLASKFVIVTVSARPVTVTTPLSLETDDHVVATGRVDDHGIGDRAVHRCRPGRD